VRRSDAPSCENGGYGLVSRTISDYPREVLKDQSIASLNGSDWTERNGPSLSSLDGWGLGGPARTLRMLHVPPSTVLLELIGWKRWDLKSVEKFKKWNWAAPVLTPSKQNRHFLDECSYSLMSASLGREVPLRARSPIRCKPLPNWCASATPHSVRSVHLGHAIAFVCSLMLCCGTAP
jgi:hypothetical protein